MVISFGRSAEARVAGHLFSGQAEHYGVTIGTSGGALSGHGVRCPATAFTALKR